MISAIGSRNFVTANGVLGRSSSSSSNTTALQASRRVGVTDFMRRLVDAGESLKKLQMDFGDVRAGAKRTHKAQTTGESRVDLRTTATKSTLEGTGPIANGTTAVDNRSPTWSKATPSTVSISGTYTGTSDVTYRIQSPTGSTPTVGSQKMTFKVYKNGVQTGTITIPATYNNTELSLGDGLSFSLGDGKLAKGSIFEFTAQAGLDLKADPNEAFDGSTGGLTNLDSVVTAGAFEVNGETISVDADDSILTVLDKINASAADVTATYDATSDTISMVRNTGGVHDITFGADTSGFLTAMKLDGATATLGKEDDRKLAIDQVAPYAGISSGSFKINGVEISVDVTTDTIQDVIARVNDSEAGVTMTLGSSERISVRSDSKEATLTLENDTTGLFSAYGLEETTYTPSETKGMNGQTVRELTQRMTELVEVFNQLAGTVTNESLLGDGAMDARDLLRGAIEKSLGGRGDQFDSGFGLTFNIGDGTNKNFMEMGSTGEKEFLRAMRRNPNEVLQTLFGTKSESGLVEDLLTAMDKAQKNLVRTYGSVGFLLDVKV